jgi:hypothetical protein
MKARRKNGRDFAFAGRRLYFRGCRLEKRRDFAEGPSRKAAEELSREDPEARTAAVSGRRSADGAADVNQGDATHAP